MGSIWKTGRAGGWRCMAPFSESSGANLVGVCSDVGRARRGGRFFQTLHSTAVPLEAFPKKLLHLRRKK